MKPYNLDLVRKYEPEAPAPRIDMELLAAKLHALHELDEPQIADEVLDQPRLVELLLWLQAKSVRPGGLLQFTREMLLQFPEWIGTPTSRQLAGREVYRLDECAAIWNELRHLYPFSLTEAEEHLLREIVTRDEIANLAAVHPKSANGESLISHAVLRAIAPSGDLEDTRDWLDGITRKITPERVWNFCATAALASLPSFFTSICTDREKVGRSDDLRPLLQSIHSAFEQAKQERIFSRVLIEKLAESGHTIDERSLARELRILGITPASVRVKQAIAKGYRVEDFAEVFTRFGIGPQNESNSWPFLQAGCFKDVIGAAVAMMNRDAAKCLDASDATAAQVWKELEFTWSERVPRCLAATASPAIMSAVSVKLNAQPGRWRVVVVPSQSAERDFWAAHADAYGITYDNSTSAVSLKRAVEDVSRVTALGLLYIRAELLLPQQGKPPRWLSWIRGLIDRGLPCSFLATPPSIDEFMRGGARQMEQWLGTPPCVRIECKLTEGELLDVALRRFPDLDRDLLMVIAANAKIGEGAAPYRPALQSLDWIAKRARCLAEGKPISIHHVAEATRDILPELNLSMPGASVFRRSSSRLNKPIKAEEFPQVDRNSTDVLTKLSAA